MSNYPDSVNPGDPKAPWNQEEDTSEQYYVVELQITVLANNPDEAVEEATHWVQKQYATRFVDVYEEKYQ